MEIRKLNFDMVSERNSALMEELEPRVLLNGDILTTMTSDVIIGQGGAKSVSYIDIDGTPVKAVLSSDGYAKVSFSGDNIQQTANASGVIVTGSNLQITNVELNNTTSRSSLLFTVSKGGDGVATVDAITGSTPLGSLSGQKINLAKSGINLSGTGSVKTLVLNDLVNGADINIAGTDVQGGTAITLGMIGTGTDIVVGASVKSLKATQWLGGSLITPWVGSITITGNKTMGVAGDFGVNMTLSGAGSAKNLALNNASINGTITTGTWIIGGDVNGIKAGGTDGTWILTASGVIKTITSNSDIEGTLQANQFGNVSAKTNMTAGLTATGMDLKGVSIGNIKAQSMGNITLRAPGGIRTINVSEWKVGKIEAGWIGTLNDTGDVKAGTAGDFGADMTLSGAGATKNMVLNNANIKGALTGGTWVINGDANIIKAGGTDSTWSVLASGAIKTLTSNSDIEGTLQANLFGNISAKTNMNVGLKAVGMDAKGLSVSGLKVQSMGNVTVSAPGGINIISVSEWKAGKIEAGWIGTLTSTGNVKAAVAGDFGADVMLSGAGATKNMVLKTANVKGTLTGGTWSIGGDVGSVMAGATDSMWAIFAGGAVKNIGVANNMKGILDALWFGNVSAKANMDIWIGSESSDANGVSIGSLKAQSAGTISMSAPGGIKSINVSEWKNGEIEAGWIGTLTSTGNIKAAAAGDFGANVTLSGVNAPKGMAITSIKAAGGITTGSWQVGGSVGSITAGAMTAGTTMNFSGGINTLTVTGNKNAGIAGDVHENLHANYIKTMNVSGNIVNSQIELAEPVTSKVKAIGTMTIKGWITGSRITTAGNIGGVTAGAVANSSCFAGVKITHDNNGDGVLDLPTPSTELNLGIEGSTIDKLSILGIKGEPYYMINSNFAAANVGTMSVAMVKTINGGVPFGIAADYVKKVITKDDVGTISYSELGDPGESINIDDVELCLC